MEKRIISAYKTGRGSIRIRARAHIETVESTNRSKIIVTELPYQVNKARLLEKIGLLVRDKNSKASVGCVMNLTKAVCGW